MEEDLEGYMDWLTQADEMGHVHSIQDGQKGLNVDVGKHEGDPVVMGLLKSTIFPLQQVLDGKAKCQMDIKISGKKIVCKEKLAALFFPYFKTYSLLVKIIYLENLMLAPMDYAMKTVV